MAQIFRQEKAVCFAESIVKRCLAFQIVLRRIPSTKWNSFELSAGLPDVA